MTASDNEVAPPKTSVLKNLMKVVLTGCFFLLVAVMAKQSGSIRHYSGEITDFFSHPGTGLLQFVWAEMILFVLAGGILVAIGIPRLWVSALAGGIFGCMSGFILGMAASILGALGVYQISSLFLPDGIKKRLAKRFEHQLPGIKANGFWWVLYARLFPFSNSTLLSAICSIFEIPMKAFIAGSAIGFMPLTLVFSFYGDASFKGDYKVIVITCLCLLIAALIHMLLRKLNVKGGNHVREA